MATCIDPATWLAAQQACRQSQAIQGLGAVRGSYQKIGDINDLYTQPLVDPCTVVKTPACPSITCPPGTTRMCLLARPGETSPGCFCNYPKPQPRPPSLTTAPGYNSSATPTQQASLVTAGFSHWGLLAAVLVGGVVVYKVATRKSS